MGLKIVPIDALPKLKARSEPALHPLFAVERWDSVEIEGNWISYEEFRLKRPLVLAVSGLLHCKELLLFGKRGRKVTQYPGSWELVPSGSVEEMDLQQAFQRELFEETGLKGEGIPFALCLARVYKLSEKNGFSRGKTRVSLYYPSAGLGIPSKSPILNKSASFL